MKKINYGWIVASISFFVIAMNAMALLGFGVFLKPLTEEFGWERGELSSVFSIAVLIGGILSLISGKLTERFSTRLLVTIAGISLTACFMLTSLVTELWQLYLTFAIPVGITISCTVIPINSTIPKWFTSGRGIAMAIPAMGFSVGGVIAPLLVERLINSVGWQQSFFILGFFPLALTIPLAQFMKQPPDEIDTGNVTQDKAVELSREVDKEASEHLPLKEMFSNKWLWAFMGMQFAFGFSTQMIFVHVAPYATDVGLDTAVAAGILSFSSAIGIGGNLAAGALADKISPRKMLVTSFGILTVSLVLLLFSRDATMFYIFAFVFGFARGAVALLQTISGVEIFGTKHFGMYMGAFMLCGTTGGVVGTPVAGFIFDSSGSYSVAFWMAIVAGVGAIFASSLILRHKSPKI